jgi:hypothetical protein
MSWIVLGATALLLMALAIFLIMLAFKYIDRKAEKEAEEEMRQRTGIPRSAPLGGPMGGLGGATGEFARKRLPTNVGNYYGSTRKSSCSTVGSGSGDDSGGR